MATVLDLYRFLSIFMVFWNVRAETLHPLDPLSASEVNKVGDIIKRKVDHPEFIRFYLIVLKEPPKPLLLQSFLNGAGEFSGVERRASAWIIYQTKAYDVEVNLSTENVDKWKSFPEGQWPVAIDYDILRIEKVIRSNDEVQRRCASLGYTNMSLVYPEPWSYGYTGDEPERQGRKLSRAYLWGSKFENDNQYAHPFPFALVVDLVSYEILQFQEMPYTENNVSPVEQTYDFTLPNATLNYMPEFQDKNFLRDVKPLSVTSPQGSNYVMHGNRIMWQKFEMRIGFTSLEGLVLHHIVYKDNGEIRPLIYRASVSDVLGNYGDPRFPVNHRMAFDRMELALGYSSNSLKPGEDCVGNVHFIDGIVSNENGEAVTKGNAVCIEEQDAGILWKHVDWRSQKYRNARSTRLAISFVTTTGNYEFVFSWYFYQDASIQFEVQPTGIIATDFVAKDSGRYPHGTVVFPQVYAPHHQHFFMVRLDMDVDGMNNTVSTFDVTTGTDKTGSGANPYGQSIVTKRTVLKTAGEGRTNTSPGTSRTWHIQSSGRKHPYSGEVTGYKLVPHNSPPILLREDSPFRKRAEFAFYDVWVTPYRDYRLFAGGEYFNGGPGLQDWVMEDQNASIDNKDVVLWHLMSVTHITRPEDFPVMPRESVGFFLKPVSFFKENPALDIPSRSEL